MTYPERARTSSLEPSRRPVLLVPRTTPSIEGRLQEASRPPCPRKIKTRRPVALGVMHQGSEYRLDPTISPSRRVARENQGRLVSSNVPHYSFARCLRQRCYRTSRRETGPQRESWKDSRGRNRMCRPPLSLGLRANLAWGTGAPGPGGGLARPRRSPSARGHERYKPFEPPLTPQLSGQDVLPEYPDLMLDYMTRYN